MKYVTLAPLKFKNCEIKAGDTFKLKNIEAIRPLLAEGKVRPLSEIMGEKYRELTGWLHQFDLGRDELKETLPELYQDIQNTIQSLDDAFANEDMPAFQDALNRVKMLYTEALFKCGRRVLVKVYSELLGCYLWIVADDEDMHSLRSQGVSEAIYTQDEIKELRKLCKEDLKELHKVKEVFPESKVEEIKNE
ncbi:MAG: hypothetical protein AB1478_07195 [Nitrospirota bacterium]